jgi:hypothetical protein
MIGVIKMMYDFYEPGYCGTIERLLRRTLVHSELYSA